MSLFLKNFAPVIEAYGIEKFPAPVIERAEARTRDLTGDEMAQLCELLIDNCERAPSIIKIAGFASMIRARRHKQNKPITTSNEILCNECNDLGVVRVQSSSKDLVMRCQNIRCTPSYYWELPRWSPLYSSSFKKSKCPPQWFTISENDTVASRAAEWRDLIRISEQTFKADGFEIERNSGGAVCP